MPTRGSALPGGRGVVARDGVVESLDPSIRRRVTHEPIAVRDPSHGAHALVLGWR
jgi:hypothetical protein